MGKTVLHYNHVRLCWKHPHMHGEDNCSVVVLDSSLETPPHAWGRLLDIPARELPVRNTPTCMGKTYISQQIRLS